MITKAAARISKALETKMNKTKILKSLIHYILIYIVLVFAQSISYAQIYTGNFEFDGTTRNYTLFLPQNYQANMPLVISMHGFGQSIQNYMDYTMMNDLADSAGFIVVYPVGVNQAWNSGAVDGRPLPNNDDVGFISALIDTLYAYYDIDISSVYCIGFSNGGEMAYRLAAELGHRINAIASVAGGLNSSANLWNPIGPIPVLDINGTADPYRNWGFDWWSVEATINYWVQNNNCSSPPDTILLFDIDTLDNSTVEKISFTDCANNSDIIQYNIINGGHHWPGADSAFNIWGGGNLNNDINTNEEIWNFFKKSTPVNVKEVIPFIPMEFILHQNYPNPFNPTTTIDYNIPNDGFVTLQVYNSLGEIVAHLVNEEKSAGTHSVDFDASAGGSSLASGIYFYKLQTGGLSETKKMSLIK